MKKLIIAFCLLLAACAPRSGSAAVLPDPSSTPFVLPTISDATVVPTAIPMVVSPTPTPIPTVAFDYYIVQPGDTLTDIATRFGVSIQYLAGINSITDVDQIYVGQVLKLTGTIQVPPPTVLTGKEIIVKLSTQMVFVYQDGNLLKTFIVSTGMKDYPTRVGTYHIWIKLASTRMTGPGYDLPNVHWTMYFDEGRGFHAKYWNNVYGRPSSHGCVNMTEEDAKWLYDWADPKTKGQVTYPSDQDPGTLVVVIP